jgi:hypothetical protein
MRNLFSEWDPEVDYMDVEFIKFWHKMKTLNSEGSEGLKKA